VKTDSDGVFRFDLPSHRPYTIALAPSINATAVLSLGIVYALGGNDIDLGSIVLDTPSRRHQKIHFVGPMRLLHVSHPAISQPPGSARFVAFFLACSDALDSCYHSTLQLLQSDGEVIQPPAVQHQIGAAQARISEDGGLVGWLADVPFCCTSYPISLQLVIFRPGEPPKTFTGDGRAIFNWKFVAGARQVAFYQDFLHGTSHQHCELRDIPSGRLIDQWDGDITSKAPAWAKSLLP
jgi:hypothetical protein